MAEYWRWPESRWTAPQLSWQRAQILTAGVDVGSVSSQAVVMADGEVYCYANRRTGSGSSDSARRAMDWALEGTGLTLDRVRYTVGTGYGRVNVPFAQRALTEIACHGRGLEVFADLLGVSINDLGELSLQVVEEPPPVSSTCVVFAKSEAAALLRKGWPKEKVLAAYTAAMAHRVAALLRRIGLEPDFAITGGIAKNVGVVSRLEKKLGLKALEPQFDTQIAGAVGAALFAKAFAEKGK
jgi:activator of 2-hydroxyglutaryl-CoA dehydratase